jgi:signal peptidase I
MKNASTQDDLTSQDLPDTGTHAIQENLEAIVVAIILALIIRHYAMEAFVIPTGSMAPTLLGEHFVVDCENCHVEWPVGKTDSDFEARCPNCNNRRRVMTSDFVDGELKASPEAILNRGRFTRGFNYFTSRFSKSPVHGGNKILVNKIVYKFKNPERFDVMVFKYPEEPNRNFIKRVVGLPNERLKIEHGDLFSNGKRIIKRWDIQEKIWHNFYDQRFPSQDTQAESWQADSPKRWAIRRKGKSGEAILKDAGRGEASTYAIFKDPSLLAPNAFIAAPAPRRTKISYVGEIRDTYGYNTTWKEGSAGYSSDGENIVVDLKLTAEVIPLGRKGPVVLALTENNIPLRVSLPTDGDQYLIERSAGDHTKVVKVIGKAAPLTVGAINKVVLAFWDRHVRLIVNGEEVMTWDDSDPKTQPVNSGAYLESSESGAIFQKVKLHRDIYYFLYSPDSPPANTEWDAEKREIIIPQDTYFALGDNCPNSSDGRKWGYLHKGHLVGRAFIVFWPTPNMRLIR